MAATVTSDTIKNAYRRYARYYDFVFGKVFHPGRQTALEHLHCRPGDRILEVGVGTGLSLGMYPSYVEVTGIDLSQDMLDIAKTRVADEGLTQVAGLEQMDAQNMTFEDSSFDKVVAMYVATVVPDVEQLVNEIRRVCKPGGTIIFLNHFQNKNPLIRRGEALIQPLAKYLGFHPDFPMEDFLHRTGFEVTVAIPVNALDYWTVLVGFNGKKD
jgi:phosphatidylethanolamine/phosphatidyl-N-methylethanolamine N-methyltransferase